MPVWLPVAVALLELVPVVDELPVLVDDDDALSVPEELPEPLADPVPVPLLDVDSVEVPEAVTVGVEDELTDAVLVPVDVIVATGLLEPLREDVAVLVLVRAAEL